MNRVEITIPPQYAEILAQQAAEQGISADELSEIAIIVNAKFIWGLLFADMHVANVVSECARHFK